MLYELILINEIEQRAKIIFLSIAHWVLSSIPADTNLPHTLRALCWLLLHRHVFW